MAAVALAAACSSPSGPARLPERTSSLAAVADSPVAGTPEPARLTIPTIDMEEPLIALGLTPDGEMEVPEDYDEVGWFAGGGRPGSVGPTVLAGHVDSTSGPAVFDRLGDLAAGDIVTVVSSAGDAADYLVERVADFSKDEFPTVDVFGASRVDRIRLITCSGDFDTAVGSYDRNFVVFGVRI